jgi:hypothetical protein
MIESRAESSVLSCPEPPPPPAAPAKKETIGQIAELLFIGHMMAA